MKRKSIILFSLLLCLALGIFFLSEQQAKIFPLNKVVVQGQYSTINQAKLKNILDLQLTKHSYFSVNLMQIQALIKQHFPWVNTVSVSKQWPDVISLDLQQRRAIAIWNNTALITAEGQLFYPKADSFPQDVPVFIGKKSQLSQLTDLYITMQNLLNQQTLVGKLLITQLKMTAENNCVVVFNHKTVVMLGQINILAQFKQFVAIYQQELEKNPKISVYVDMRYNHGLAVQWQKTN